MSESQYLIIEKEFWTCPVSLFGGLSFFFIGFGVGVLIGKFA